MLSLFIWNFGPTELILCLLALLFLKLVFFRRKKQPRSDHTPYQRTITPESKLLRSCPDCGHVNKAFFVACPMCGTKF